MRLCMAPKWVQASLHWKWTLGGKSLAAPGAWTQHCTWLFSRTRSQQSYTPPHNLRDHLRSKVGFSTDFIIANPMLIENCLIFTDSLLTLMFKKDGGGGLGWQMVSFFIVSGSNYAVKVLGDTNLKMGCCFYSPVLFFVIQQPLYISTPWCCFLSQFLVAYKEHVP